MQNMSMLRPMSASAQAAYMRTVQFASRHGVHAAAASGATCLRRRCVCVRFCKVCLRVHSDDTAPRPAMAATLVSTVYDGCCPTRRTHST